ncbi:MAG: hypothetical protein LDL07_10195, partial [Desulfarculus sp.]|nr:hypothetical protein [Desulfarculus sp.]
MSVATYRRRFAPDEAPAALWDLLFRWAEWRSVVGCPRSPMMPQPVYTWEIQDGVAVAMREGFCSIPSTAPRNPSRLEEFNAAFQELAEGHQVAVLAILEFINEPWLKGEKWETCLTGLRLGARD